MLIQHLLGGMLERFARKHDIEAPWFRTRGWVEGANKGESEQWYKAMGLCVGRTYQTSVGEGGLCGLCPSISLLFSPSISFTFECPKEPMFLLLINEMFPLSCKLLTAQFIFFYDLLCCQAVIVLLMSACREVFLCRLIIRWSHKIVLPWHWRGHKMRWVVFSRLFMTGMLPGMNLCSADVHVTTSPGNSVPVRSGGMKLYLLG